MATYSVGVTEKIQNKIRDYRKSREITIGGFATLALENILKDTRTREKIIKELQSQGGRKCGPKKLKDGGH